MRAIDADELWYEDVRCTDGYTYMVVHAPQIDDAPTIDVGVWIGVEDELPDLKENVLVYDGAYHMRKLSKEQHQGHQCWDLGNGNLEIIDSSEFWMRLPEIPKSETKQ